MLIAALSGRALAEAARRSGYAPLVADLFGDLDTSAAAEAHELVPGNLRHGFSAKRLLAALDRLAAAGRSPEGLVWGSGFEDRPALLHRLAGRAPLLGNGPGAVQRVKHPSSLAVLCERANVPHPETRLGLVEGSGWLKKRAGGSGGVHVRPASSLGERLGSGVETIKNWRRRPYFQRRVVGRPVSALFLSNGRAALVLGFSEQWPSPASRQPFRFGGAVRPALLTEPQEASLTQAVARLAPHCELVGLNSADFMVSAGGFHLLEINPRPGATLDLFPIPELFEWHVVACRGRLPNESPSLPGAMALAVAYAGRPVRLPRGFTWPDWAADLQRPEQPVAAGAPLCTVLASAGSADAAHALAARRVAEIFSRAENAA